MDPELVAYIRENHETHTREAITQHLLKAGHDLREIEAAWGAVLAPAPGAEQASAAEDEEREAARAAIAAATRPSTPVVQPAPRLRWGRFWFALVGFVVGLLLLTNLANALSVVFGLFLYPALLLTALIYAIVRRKTDQEVSAGLLCGLAVAVVLLVVAPGLCTVAAGNL